jgi:hypothetical protein
MADTKAYLLDMLAETERMPSFLLLMVIENNTFT